MEPSRQSRRLRGNPRGQLPASLRAQDLPINEVLTMLQNVHIWDTDLRKNTQNHDAGVTNCDHNAAMSLSLKRTPSYSFTVVRVIS